MNPNNYNFSSFRVIHKIGFFAGPYPDIKIIGGMAIIHIFNSQTLKQSISKEGNRAAHE